MHTLMYTISNDAALKLVQIIMSKQLKNVYKEGIGVEQVSNFVLGRTVFSHIIICL